MAHLSRKVHDFQCFSRVKEYGACFKAAGDSPVERLIDISPTAQDTRGVLKT
jgi:hypothetical protein